MSQDARVRVRLDTNEAQRSVGKLNDGLDKSTDKATKFSTTFVRGLRSAGVIAAAVAGAANAAVPGIAGAGAGTIGALAGQGSRQLFGEEFGTGGREFVARQNALDRASSNVQELVGAGGNISDSAIRTLLEQERQLALPGERNRQRVVQLAGDQKANEVADAFSSGLDDTLGSLDRTIQDMLSWFRSG